MHRALFAGFIRGTTEVGNKLSSASRINTSVVYSRCHSPIPRVFSTNFTTTGGNITYSMSVVGESCDGFRILITRTNNLSGIPRKFYVSWTADLGKCMHF